MKRRFIMWRWDQGRLLYFRFDVLREIAKVLVNFDNCDLGPVGEIFRQKIMDDTGMPFAPNRIDYPVKRNYKRVFQCAFPKFRFPFPAFDDYNPNDTRIYPFCAILKYLIAQQELGVESKISLDEVVSYLIANNCTGEEDIDFYKQLTPKECSIDPRQIREMLIFVSQLNILKVYDKYLHLEPLSESTKKNLLNTVLVPDNRTPAKDALEEFMQMTRLDSKLVVPEVELFAAAPSDIEFVEGNRKRVEHLRVERSPLLRKYYRDHHPEARCCACQKDMRVVYPWTDYMLDIHHLLPLASTINISTKGTSLEDVVGLCPSCHRAVHMFYRKWLKENNQIDFISKQEAQDVFLLAAKNIA